MTKIQVIAFVKKNPNIIPDLIRFASNNPKNDHLYCVWSIDDIKGEAKDNFNKELTDEQAREVLGILESGKTEGISWDVINDALTTYLEEDEDTQEDL